MSVDRTYDVRRLSEKGVALSTFAGRSKLVSTTSLTSFLDFRRSKPDFFALFTQCSQKQTVISSEGSGSICVPNISWWSPCCREAGKQEDSSIMALRP